MIRALVFGFLLASPLIAAATDSLSLKLIPLDAKVKAGSKIMVRVVTTNTSDRPITFHNISRNCDYSFRVLTTTGAPAPETEFKKKLACTGGSDPFEITSRNIVVTLMPGESSSEDILITELYDMSPAGTYTMQVNRAFHDIGQITSNVVSVDVTP